METRLSDDVISIHLHSGVCQREDESAEHDFHQDVEGAILEAEACLDPERPQGDHEEGPDQPPHPHGEQVQVSHQEHQRPRDRRNFTSVFEPEQCPKVDVDGRDQCDHDDPERDRASTSVSCREDDYAEGERHVIRDGVEDVRLENMASVRHGVPRLEQDEGHEEMENRDAVHASRPHDQGKQGEHE